ncbi:MAG: secretin N-terminal domain-containing protein, partial [Candidatus Firestonebacteria bacterium]
VATPSELKAEEESAIVETRYFVINFAKAAELQASITPFMSGSGKIQSDARTNTLIITDITSKMETFANLIESLDTKTAQVNIEAKLVDLKVESEDKLGIRWDIETGSTAGVGSGLMTDLYPGTANTTQLKASISPPTTSAAKAGQFQFGIAGNTSFWIALDALVKNNDANLIANPRITTVDNKTATINITQAYTYTSGFNAQTGVTTYASVDAGVTLEVTPQINRNDYVTLQVKPMVSSIVSAGPPPVVDSRTANTQVLIKDGDTFVIGGLIREDEVVTIHKVPILGDIPLLGSILFQNKTVGKTKRDLVVFMTPHIIR